MAIEVTFHDDAAEVLKDAGAFLVREPVLHNIILTLLHARAAHPEPGRYWLAREDARIVGMVFQSPVKWPATIPPMIPGVVGALVDHIAASGVRIPGVNGEAGTVASFAGQWTERTKAAGIPFMGMRLYELEQVSELPAVRGRLRNAEDGDRDLLVEWVRHFQIEIGEPDFDAAALVGQWLPAGQIWIWDDEGPVSMAVTRATVESVVRVAGVYTPRDRRQRGYASACVGELSRLIRQQGNRPILYTDLGNPTSNSVYRKIGYKAVAEALRYRFE